MRRSRAAFAAAVLIIVAPLLVPGPAAGATPYWKGRDFARGIATAADGWTGYLLDGWGGLYPLAHGPGTVPPAMGAPYWQNWDIARDLTMLPDGSGGYVLDGWGGIHPFSVGNRPRPAVASGSPYWRNWDIARAIALAPDGTGGYVVDAYGGVHRFRVGSNPFPPPIVGVPYIMGLDWVEGATIRPDGTMQVVDGRGRIYDGAPAGAAFSGRPTEMGRWGSWDIIRGVTNLSRGRSLVVDGYGGLHTYAAPTTTAATNYSFMATDGDGNAVRYNPCSAVHYVINTAAAPPGGVDLVHQSFARLSAWSGLRFVYDGTTLEPPTTNRAASQPLLYGNRPAPVLVAFTQPSVISSLAGGVAGLGGSLSRLASPGRREFVTGLALLDGPQLGNYPTGFGNGVTQGDIVLHELGHVLGLGHTSEPSEFMYPTATTTPTPVGLGDRAGLNRLGSPLGCIAPVAAASTTDVAAAAPSDEWVVAVG